MRRLLIAFATLALLVVAAYGIWIQRPALKHPQLIDDAITSSLERHQAYQEHARDPQKNGFLSKTFSPFWGRKDQEQKSNSQVGKVFSAWNQDYSTAGKGELVDHVALQESQDPAYLKAREDLAKLVPELLSELNKPYFVAPEDKPTTFATMVPNFIAMRAVSQALAGYARSLTAEGKPAEAAKVLEGGLSFGHNVGGHGMLISDMISVAMLAIIHDAALGCLNPESNLSADQWREFAQRALDSAPSERLLYQSLQAEIWVAHNSLETGAIGDEVGELGSALALPGFMAREMRIYKNVMSECLLAVEAGRRFEIDLDLGVGGMLKGEAGVIAAILVPNFTRAGLQISQIRKKLLSLGAAAGVLAYKKTHGDYPETLERLQEVGVKLPWEGPNPDWLEYEKQDGSARLVTSVAAEHDSSPYYMSYGELPWYQADEAQQKLILKL